MKRSKGYRVVAPDRYLRVVDEPLAVVVSLDGETMARSSRARRLLEGDREPVVYVPREDVDVGRLVSSGQSYRCRWKGDAAYFHVDLRDRTLENVVWGYPDAPDAVAELRDLVAFDPDTFDIAFGERPMDRPVDDSGDDPTLDRTGAPIECAADGSIGNSPGNSPDRSVADLAASVTGAAHPDRDDAAEASGSPAGRSA